MKRNNIPDHRIDSDIHEANTLAMPPGPVVSITVEKPDPRKIAFEDAAAVTVFDTEKRTPLRNLTEVVRKRIRERIIKGEYSADPLQVLCELAADPNRDDKIRVMAARAACEYLHTKKSSIKVFDDIRDESKEIAAETADAKRKRLAQAVKAMLEAPTNVE